MGRQGHRVDTDRKVIGTTPWSRHSLGKNYVSRLSRGSVDVGVDCSTIRLLGGLNTLKIQGNT